jgi:alginate O-acetyltransferase complex protein AlgI
VTTAALVARLAVARQQLRVVPVAAAPWDGSLLVREYSMLPMGLILLACFLPRVNILLLLGAAVAVFVIGESRLSRRARLALLLAVIGAFVFQRYQHPRPPVPYVALGGGALEAFFILRCVDFVMSRRAEEWPRGATGRFARFFLWIFFLPTLFVGPVVLYREFYRKYQPEVLNWTALVVPNATKIAWGAVKFYWLSRGVRVVSEALAAAAPTVAPGAHPWLAGVDPRLLLWSVVWLGLVDFYLAFSGFSDMAIGLSRLMGFNLDENFDRPLLATTPVDYWRKTNISTYRWLMTYVFFPYWRHRQVAAKVMTTFLVSALWHVTVTFIESWQAALQVLIALSIFGIAVAVLMHLGRVPWIARLTQAPPGPGAALVRVGQWGLTFCFVAVVHRLFWNGLTGQPLASSVHEFRRLFLGS